MGVVTDNGMFFQVKLVKFAMSEFIPSCVPVVGTSTFDISNVSDVLLSQVPGAVDHSVSEKSTVLYCHDQPDCKVPSRQILLTFMA